MKENAACQSLRMVSEPRKQNSRVPDVPDRHEPVKSYFRTPSIQNL